MKEEFLIGGRNLTLAECVTFGMAGAGAILDRKSKGASDLEAVFTPSLEVERGINRSYGLHLTIDFRKVSPRRASDCEFINQLMNELPATVGMQTLFPATTLYYDGGKNPEDSGVTSIVGLTTSHASIHLYDKKGTGYFDLFSCKLFDPAKVIARVTHLLGSIRFDVQLLIRGRGFNPDANIENRS